MKVIYSKSLKVKVYHKPGCPYLKQIRSTNLASININQAFKEPTFCECKYCGGIKGYSKVFKKRKNRYKFEKGMRCYWDDETNALYLMTDVGVWKLVFDRHIHQFILYHQNHSWWNLNRPIEKQFHTAFHRQSDVAPTYNFDRIVDYIYSHDRNRKIELEDYRKLPQKTKRQKKFYQAAKNRAKRREKKRMDKIFADLNKK